MRWGKTMVPAALIAALCPVARAAAGEGPAEVRMTLTEAVEHALEKNEGLVVELESLRSAEAALAGARGAYDPLFEVQGSWERASLPVNSAFSGAPDGRLAPTNRSLGADASVRQLLPTGGEVSVRASAARQTTDGTFTLLSPAYDTSVGVELRQPLLRGRALDAARLNLKVTAAERSRAVASLRREVTETVAAVERTYWALVAAREDVGVREEAVRLAEEQLRETKLRIEKGAAPETEAAQPNSE
ncbi:MAG: TolC family protein [Acidobacteriia bacterium]|nr:TolC family protein [Terriglobia bacterium]